jgi:hypothetical protein
MTLIEVLMSRDGLTEKQAQRAIDDARAMIYEGYDPEEILLDEFGLEADYVFDLLEDL